MLTLMIKTTLIAAVAGLTLLSVAAATASAERYPINGVGSAGCGEWNAKAKGAARNPNDQTMRLIQTSWAQGFLTALNSVAMINGRADWLDGVQLSEVISGIDKHCAVNPGDQIVTAVLAVSQTLENKAAARTDHLTPGITADIVAALERNHALTSAQTRCVIYLLEQETDAYIEVQVRERHGQGCPGDPGTGPRLFNVRYEKRSHAVLKENDAMDGYDRLR